MICFFPIRFPDALFHMTIPVVVADGIVQPWERFLDYRSFTSKLNTSEMVTAAQHSAAMTSGQLPEPHEYFGAEMAAHVTEFEAALDAGDDRRLQASHVYRKREALLRNRAWFSWNPKHEKNAWRLLILELWCRTPKGRLDQICRRPASTIAFQRYV
jgi:hypothetical protein